MHRPDCGLVDKSWRLAGQSQTSRRESRYLLSWLSGLLSESRFIGGFFLIVEVQTVHNKLPALVLATLFVLFNMKDVTRLHREQRVLPHARLLAILQELVAHLQTAHHLSLVRLHHLLFGGQRLGRVYIWSGLLLIGETSLLFVCVFLG